MVVSDNETWSLCMLQQSLSSYHQDFHSEWKTHTLYTYKYTHLNTVQVLHLLTLLFNLKLDYYCLIRTRKMIPCSASHSNLNEKHLKLSNYFIFSFVLFSSCPKIGQIVVSIVLTQKQFSYKIYINIIYL